MYEVDKMSVPKIADALGMSYAGVYHRFKSFGIKSRSLSDARNLRSVGTAENKLMISRKRLKNLYFDHKLGIPEIAGLCGVSRSILYSRMINFGFICRPVSDSQRYVQLKSYMTKAQLEKAYNVDRLSMQKCADLFGLSVSGMCARLTRFGIKRRSRQEAWLLHRVVLSQDVLLNAHAEYLKKNQTLTSVASALGVSRDTLRKCFVSAGLMIRSPHEMGRRPLKTVPRLKPSDLAYLAGVLAGDGHLNRRCHSFSLGVTDYDFAKNVFNILAEVGSPVYSVRFMSRKNPRRKDIHRVEFYGMNLEKQFDEINFSLLPENLKIRFIDGFIDSEGSVPTTAKWISICNTNYKLLCEISEFFKKLGIANYIYKDPDKLGRRNKACYQIYIRALVDIRRFSEIFVFSIKRKQMRLLALRSETKRIWKDAYKVGC
jgi:intein-encoded DNA endonuclease-like protein